MVKSRFDRWLSKRLEPMEFVCIKGFSGFTFPVEFRKHGSRAHAIVLAHAQVLYEVSKWK